MLRPQDRVYREYSVQPCYNTSLLSLHKFALNVCRGLAPATSGYLQARGSTSGEVVVQALRSRHWSTLPSTETVGVFMEDCFQCGIEPHYHPITLKMVGGRVQLLNP